MRRIATAAVLVPLILGAIFGLSKTVFAWVVVVVFTACAWEYAQVNRLIAKQWIYALLIAAASAAWLRLLVVEPSLALLPASALAMGAVWVVAGLQPIDRLATAAAMAAFGLLYFVVAARSLTAVHAVDEWLVLLLVAIVALGDSAAYYVGRATGKRKMAPRVSPNKTWEGAGASLLMAVFVATGWAVWRGLDPAPWAAVGVATNVAAQAGDLLQSAFKRQAGVKDSSNLLPGHGGVWDRTDAILLASPVFAAMLTWVRLT